MYAMFGNEIPVELETLDLRNEFSKRVDVGEIKSIISEASLRKNIDSIGTVDISGNDLGTNITIEDFNKMLGHIDKIFPKLNKLVLNENNLYKWFESNDEIASDINLNFMCTVKSIDISQNGLFFCGLPYETLFMILKSLPEELEILDLTQYSWHPSTNNNYEYTEKELIDIVSIAGKHCKSLKKMFFDEELERPLRLDGTFEALKKLVKQLQQKEETKEVEKKENVLSTICGK